MGPTEATSKNSRNVESYFYSRHLYRSIEVFFSDGSFFSAVTLFIPGSLDEIKCLLYIFTIWLSIDPTAKWSLDSAISFFDGFIKEVSLNTFIFLLNRLFLDITSDTL